ncbi:MarR family winged helix-turn-helix transcriptional regulator [Neptunitalea lumnitzerae]|uniref:MarR family transcriptional regulator n=1 Tax=Neptunitalea lumnitzerae TaxID=2965509 RepID=A0ABQ5MLL0_9FLAO|nr:MarR family transcriptional regulator [Neptunitalea sp. Y10]GLB50279.1 MarR family transcriptional regulator [Neptunitalea sp. Y10]
MEPTNDYQKLENQICFPLYAASRLVTKCYQPLLKDFGITYPQYLVLLVLWEKDEVSLSYISERLLLQSNTLTPLVKRMEEMELLSRKRSDTDERSIIISLSDKGKQMKTEAQQVPVALASNFQFSVEEMITLKGLLDKLIRNVE